MAALAFSSPTTCMLVGSQAVNLKNGRTGRKRLTSQFHVRGRSACDGIKIGSVVTPLKKNGKRVTYNPVVASAEPIDAVTPSLPIIVGSVALAIPFFVAAVLFGERIMRQRACPTCKGSGLVTTNSKFYKRCPT